MKNLILLKSNLIEVPAVGRKKPSAQIVGTLLSNLASYGYAPSKQVAAALSASSDQLLKTWWAGLEPLLQDVTGANRKMSDVVVYKNFPAEVLEMSQAQYWVNQILMYWGLPNELFTTEEKPRASMLESLQLKVLHAANAGSLQQVFNGLLKAPARWTEEQLKYALYLLQNADLDFNVAEIAFKENMALFVSKLIEAGVKVKVKSATDTLRLAVGLSGGDVSFREESKIKLSKSQRRYLLGLLEQSTNLAEDVARDRERWKRFMRALHPNDYMTRKGKRKGAVALYPTVSNVYNQLYNDNVSSFNGDVEALILSKDEAVFKLLKSRPGEFARRLNQTMNVFGRDAVEHFGQVADRLKVGQLLKLRRYLAGVNTRKFRTIAPKGNWTNLQVLENTNRQPKTWLKSLDETISSAIRGKLKGKLKTSVNLSPSADLVKLQTNDQELASYGRGTVFPIPENIQFLRTASYWKKKGGGVVWFDNGINFFDADWKSKGTLCWNRTDMGGAAAFSGDPMNTKDADGRACQMIDLYIDKLQKKGVRYAVWNILCFSQVKFNEAEVFAAFQWGEEAQKGKTFEASRAQFAFPVTGDTLTKYILYIDLEERKIVYMDANLRSNTSSAANNVGTLEKLMPAFVEYLDTLPSVHDLFAPMRQSKSGVVVTYDDKDIKLKGETAYVFRPQNEANSFKPLELSELLSS